MELEEANQLVTAQMFEFGPLHEKRYEIEKILKLLPIQTGDILYRRGNAKGPFGLPFSRLISLLSKSDYSHAAMTLIVNGYPFVLEINDQGTLLYRMIDWLDMSYTGNFSVYRYKGINEELKEDIKMEIEKFLDADPEYDFTFSDPNKFYCTESVVVIYDRVGVKLIEPSKIKDVVSLPVYVILKIGSAIFSLFSEASLPFNKGLYFVGNEDQGMISSKETFEIYTHKENL